MDARVRFVGSNGNGDDVIVSVMDDDGEFEACCLLATLPNVAMDDVVEIHATANGRRVVLKRIPEQHIPRDAYSFTFRADGGTFEMCLTAYDDDERNVVITMSDARTLRGTYFTVAEWDAYWARERQYQQEQQYFDMKRPYNQLYNGDAKYMPYPWRVDGVDEPGRVFAALGAIMNRQ